MQFNSVDFMLFFPIVIVTYFIIPRKWRKYWLLLASYYFYMSWNAKYAVLIAGSTLITYACGLLLERIDAHSCVHSPTMKKLILIGCIVANLNILAIFKYGNFAIDSLNFLLNTLHITPIQSRLEFLLPVGISFYTFQALGYIIDVYRGEVNAEHNLVRYALFVSFFPQLVAGPIERSRNLLAQMRNIENFNLWNARRITSGAIMMVWGLFMKMVIADRVAIVVNNVFSNYMNYGSTELIFSAICFTLQIYCDFASYSTIAVGTAKIIGFELMENFNTPYFAISIRDFWNRWHISLSTWFRDYVYIPLGGNRKGKLRKAINILIVFLVSGLWHGANWNFVAWGGIHGFYQVIGDLSEKPRKLLREKLRIKTNCISWRILQTLCTFCLVSFAWIFFRSESITDAYRFIKRIFERPTPWILFNGGIYNLGLDRVEMNILFFSVMILFLISLIRYIKNQTLDTFLFEQNLWFEWSVLILLIIMIFVFGKYGPDYNPQQFIYFQF